jgi:hypothetical protein
MKNSKLKLDIKINNLNHYIFKLKIYNVFILLQNKKDGYFLSLKIKLSVN